MLKSTVKLTAIIFAVTMTIYLGLSFIRGNDDGIVALEGYEHAVIICGEALIVNTGHFEDSEIGDLVDLAKDTCPRKGD